MRTSIATTGFSDELMTKQMTKQLLFNPNSIRFAHDSIADDKIATARGGGGGIALWKRVGSS